MTLGPVKEVTGLLSCRYEPEALAQNPQRVPSEPADRPSYFGAGLDEKLLRMTVPPGGVSTFATDPSAKSRESVRNRSPIISMTVFAWLWSSPFTLAIRLRGELVNWHEALRVTEFTEHASSNCEGVWLVTVNCPPPSGTTVRITGCGWPPGAVKVPGI